MSPTGDRDGLPGSNSSDAAAIGVNENVACHSGFAYEERPVALTWENQRQAIVRILAEWRTPEEKIFLVYTESGRKFRLAYHPATAAWQIEQV